MVNWILTVDFEVEADSKIEAADKLREILYNNGADFSLDPEVDRELFEELGITYD